MLYEEVIDVRDEIIGRQEDFEVRIKSSEEELFKREKEVLAREIEAADALREAEKQIQHYSTITKKKKEALDRFYEEKGIKDA